MVTIVGITNCDTVDQNILTKFMVLWILMVYAHLLHQGFMMTLSCTFGQHKPKHFHADWWKISVL